MSIPLVMTVIGEDRPGLVELVARLVAQHGGNWLESRMCRLGGQFAGILRVRVPRQTQTALTASLEQLGQSGLKVVVSPDADEAVQLRQLANLELVGQDRPGIVQQITAALANHRVNVEELTTECVSAPMSGETLFRAAARLSVPSDCDVGGLRRELERIAADLLVELRFGEITSEP